MSTYGVMKRAASSRLMPSVVCVKSFVPKLKNSATTAISSAVIAPRGISIIVPTRYLKVTPFSFITSAATRRTIFSWFASSFTLPTSGIITSGSTLIPFAWTLAAASKMARDCISVISGKMMPRRQPRNPSIGLNSCRPSTR